MKIERISYNKIKVTLSVYDLKHWNVDIDDLSYNSPQAQEMFWTVMKQAEIETGFYIEDSQLIIEAIPFQADGFILIITRVEDDKDIENIQKYLRNKIKKPEIRVKKKPKIPDTNLLLFMFNNFDDLCNASIRIRGMFSGESKVYKYNNNYYLLLNTENIDSRDSKSISTLLTEYGYKMNHSDIIEGFMGEHATIIINNDAIQVLEDFFK